MVKNYKTYIFTTCNPNKTQVISLGYPMFPGFDYIGLP